jgi:hypothetical protein
MGHLFAQRKKIMERLSRTESGMESTRESESENLKQAIALLRELGTRALEENSIWLIMHRDHPLKVTGGS